MTLLTLCLTFFLILNPLGNLKVFLSVFEGMKHSRQSFVIAREMIIALGAMFLFAFFGKEITHIFSLDTTTVFITSGLILFLVAIKILFPPKEEHLPRIHGEEPFLIPIAIPVVASPALLATIMLFSNTEQLVMPIIFAILIAWFISAIIFLGSRKILRVLGPNGLLAIERLMGMVLVFLSVQRVMDGVLLFMSQQK
jgi:multiple antibiotic resistance protein